MSGAARVALAAVVLLIATGALAAPARLVSATFSCGCKSYTFAVSGEGLDQPYPIVSYNISLTPPSGEPIAIVDSFPVTAEKDGKFHKTIRGSWEKFEFKLKGNYTLSGSAVLASNLIPLHTLNIAFSRPRLNCSRSR